MFFTVIESPDRELSIPANDVFQNLVVVERDVAKVCLFMWLSRTAVHGTSILQLSYHPPNIDFLTTLL